MLERSQQEGMAGGRTAVLPTLLRIAVLGVVSALLMQAQAKGGNSEDSIPGKVQAPAEYRLGPEDVIDVFVWKEPDLSATVTVRPDGKVSLPLANELEASGKTAQELQQEIIKRLQQYLSEPVVNVMVKQINSMKISVLGEVRKPDVYRIKNRVSLLDAIAMAGGFTDLAKPNKVVVLRNTPEGVKRFQINIKQAVGDGKSAPFYLQSQDTVYVE